MPDHHRRTRLPAFPSRCILLAVVATSWLLSAAVAQEFSSTWQNSHDRVWLGPEYWANPMEDWQLTRGGIECTSAGPGRNVHLLTHQLSDRAESFELSVTVDQIDGKLGAAGFEVGIHDDINDYRGNCVWGSGVPALLGTDGQLRLATQQTQLDDIEFKQLRLTLRGEPDGTMFALTLNVSDRQGRSLGKLSAKVPAERLIGNVAVSHNSNVRFPAARRGNNQPRRQAPSARFRFTNWRVSGEKFDVDPDHRFGPILWSMYSVSDSRSDEGYVLKLSAILPPIGAEDARQVLLEFERDGQWQSAGQANVHPKAYVATFRIPQWNADARTPFRLRYALTGRDGSVEDSVWSGTIRRQPSDRPLVLGGLTCQEHRGFPYGPVAEHLAVADPDLLFFSGDQIYESSGGFGIIRRPADRAIINFLRKQYMFGWAFGKVMAHRPTLCIPDDHDVFQGNIWGEGGKAMPAGGNTSTDGGYIEPVEMVEVVHRINTAHHPDFFDPTPVKQNMSVYYGDMVYGRVSFAIIGDRQFKSAPGRVETGSGRADHVTSPDIDVSTLDKPGLVLLGERQEKFLEHWVGDWRGADMKVLLSETVFANAATHHGGYDGFLYADLDSGGWPQTARNRTLRILRKGFPLHVNGDQHLTTLIQYGADEPRDSCHSFCTPAISVGYQRWWRPDEVGRAHTDRPSHGLPNTGSYLDGFGNHMHVYAVGNPEGSRDPNRYQQAHIKASGFAIVRIDRNKREYVCEAYRFLKTDPNAKLPEQFAGWPVVIKQRSNDGRKTAGWLPPVEVSGIENPVIRVINDETGELVYATRFQGRRYVPHVYETGTYRIEIGAQETGQMQQRRGLKSSENRDQSALEFRFE